MSKPALKSELVSAFSKYGEVTCVAVDAVNATALVNYESEDSATLALQDVKEDKSICKMLGRKIQVSRSSYESSWHFYLVDCTTCTFI